MYKTTIIDKKVEETHKYCDVCGIEIVMDLACSVARCEYCKKDLCDKCVGHEECGIGDYRTVYCKQCWDAGFMYREEIDYLEELVEKMYEKWEKKCSKKDVV